MTKGTGAQQFFKEDTMFQLGDRLELIGSSKRGGYGDTILHDVADTVTVAEVVSSQFGDWQFVRIVGHDRLFPADWFVKIN
ncbi:MAG: hypothetical protein A3B91_00190 [Candidatus Yanofskybacteria bacterium RIFCSPHIGHO2_02_FULL_41_29]|uniref:Uncharacterized protein n=1 Tax=Candidatus Yanofskybacteria bacterium RIFCSPHIGHO2_01_FULL_41_53 TaxID=1802663 RepID=A0A1F8EJA7_9BACT|nr:MAG: hypothetical protein A2650_03245 [Candidatus Yanofskybacteria bacterium RIFCSPHIGHO2_01_FULL_41_53]OGN10542.1 MAG: hypothetical protein A3B91_00190 [Candidatus Yanofskybacteria bacterium RIFCSPHIGHO2_02_FULL_41_29]OGN17944.1 MAG: hypothetical protein A3F48_04550 [Candidatus Yanofskybacteria bacterium RIFCSPHIGHO2_12_FULL_41_9]OGN21689.1 MAG: hypothetical protein A2916_03965 [Candidatus Yanofskybacteria bacterium RIFCSPLOWO2_01_FULL_41_67]OGN29204.1 MAG: hypothetical protein A3H54_03440 